MFTWYKKLLSNNFWNLTLVKKSILLFIAATTLISCRSPKTDRVQSIFVYATGGKVSYIDFSGPDMASKVIYQGASGSIISRISRIDNNTFLFDECSEKCSIKLHNFKTGHDEILRSGRLPTYVPKHETYFFYDESEDGQIWLFLTKLKNPIGKEKIGPAPKDVILKNKIRKSVTRPAVAISPDEIIFFGKDNRLYRYQITDKKIVHTELTNCEPILWRSAKKQLLYRDYKTKKLFLTNLVDDQKDELPKLFGGYGYTYSSTLDALIYRKARFQFPFGEAYDLFIYFFEEKKEEKMRSNMSIRSGFLIQK